MKANKMEQHLYQIASLQQGYFTALQAKEAGYADSRFAYHVKQGRWTREGRGIYRLVNYPIEERGDLVYWSLWSCNRFGKMQGVFSHQTALSLHNLSDVMPAAYHLIVPKSFRKYHKTPSNLRLHYEDIRENEVIEFEGYRVTTPERTIRDILSDETISEEITIQAIRDGLHNGIISLGFLKELRNTLQSQRVQQIINGAILNE